MHEVIPFRFEDLNIRVVADERGEPLFVGKDICAALGYANPNKAMGDHCRGVTNRYPIVDSLERTQAARVLTEADMMRLVVNSTLPAAQRFERWVFEDVLPTIRKTGGYGLASVSAAHLEEAVRQQVGGIVKSVVHRQIEDAIELALPALVEGVIARRQIGTNPDNTPAAIHASAHVVVHLWVGEETA